MSKLITVSENLLEDILPHLKGTPFSTEMARLGMTQVVVYQHKRN